MSRRLIWRVLLGALLLILAAGLIAPQLNVDRLRSRLQVALEQSLHHPVALREVRLNLFQGPGFTARDVTIQELPGFGAEPLAYVNELRAQVRLTSLFTRRLQFTQLTLIQPSVNLAKKSDGEWNVQVLLNQLLTGQTGPFVPIQVIGGRLNFRVGERKSPFYVANADMDVTLSRGSQPVISIDFRGQPARTDRAEQGLGQFSGSGRWQNGQLSLDLQLKRSAVGELATLMQGQSYGLQGFVASRARLSGPLAQLQITGQMQSEDLGRWALLPFWSGAAQAQYAGQINLLEQKLELHTVGGDKNRPMGFQIRGYEMFTRPRWAAAITMQQLPLATVLPVVRNLGREVPDALRMQGLLTGVVGYATSGGLQGTVQVREAALQVASSPIFRSAEASLYLSGDSIQLQPVELTAEGRQTIHLAVTYQQMTPGWEIALRGEALQIADLGAALDSLGVVRPPVLRYCGTGRWTGTVQYRLGANAAAWSGGAELRDAVVALPILAEPLRLRGGAVSIDGDHVTLSEIRGRVGPLEIAGEYEYTPGDPRPHRVRLLTPRASLADLERLLAPLHQPSRGFLARTLRLGRETLPEWLTEQRVEGTVRAGVFALGPVELQNMQGRLLLDGTHIEVRGVTGRYQNAPVTGTVIADMRPAGPAYRVTGEVRRWPWRNGTVDVEGTLDTSGLGMDLLANLHAAGTVHARSVALLTAEGDASPNIRNLSSRFEYRPVSGARLDHLQANWGGEVYNGVGTITATGKLEVDLVSKDETVRLAGTVDPWQVEIAEQ